MALESRVLITVAICALLIRVGALGDPGGCSATRLPPLLDIASGNTGAGTQRCSERRGRNAPAAADPTDSAGTTGPGNGDAGPFGIAMAFMYYAPRDPATIQRIAAAKRTLAGASLYLSVCIDHGDSDPAHDPNHGTMGAITPVCHKNTTDGVTIRAELDVLRAAGVRVLHYVHSRQLYRDGKPAPCCKCCDSLGNVTRRIDTELTAFPNDGIFTDNVVANASHAEFYRAVQRETQSRGMAHTWMNGNCHANKCRGFDPEFTDLADVVTVWEGYVSDFTEDALELPNLTPAQQKKLSVMV
jgi:hypothetical protein